MPCIFAKVIKPWLQSSPNYRPWKGYVFDNAVDNVSILALSGT